MAWLGFASTGKDLGRWSWVLWATRRHAICSIKLGIGLQLLLRLAGAVIADSGWFDWLGADRLCSFTVLIWRVIEQYNCTQIWFWNMPDSEYLKRKDFVRQTRLGWVLYSLINGWMRLWTQQDAWRSFSQVGYWLFLQHLLLLNIQIPSCLITAMQYVFGILRLVRLVYSPSPPIWRRCVTVSRFPRRWTPVWHVRGTAIWLHDFKTLI